MNDYLLPERPNKRVFYGSTTSMFDAEEDEEQYFAFSKAAADSEFSIVGVTNSVAPSIMPNNNQGTLDGGEKGGSAMELTSSVNSHDSMPVDDTKIHTPNNKGTGANIDVPNVGCKAEPSSKENAENTDGNKIGKSNSSKSPSSTSSSQQTPQPQTTTNNKKRTRATPEQLAILEDTFKTNTSPNSKVREALAEKVNMSERSIQIWFQNRRAKMKAMQKRAHLMINQDAIGHFMTCMPNYGPYPFRMPIHPQRIPLPRSYSASDLTPTLNNVTLAGMRPQPNSGLGITVPQVPQGFWPSGPLTAPITSLGGSDSSHLMNGFPFSANPIVTPQQQAPRFPISPNASPNSNAMNATQAIRLVSPTGGIPIKMNDQSASISQPQQFTPPQEFLTPNFNNNQVSVISCDTLNIGTWRRILTTQAPTDLLCYYTIPQNVFTYHITNENTQFKMEFPLTDITSIEYRSIDDIFSQIAVEVKDPPHFYMESSQGGWSLCKDFTEDKQATRHMRHVMKGRAAAMKPQLIKLMRDCPLLAKVVTILDAPVENQNPEGINNDADKQTNEQDQQNPPRRSSFPSGSIADNLRFGDGICTPTPNDKHNSLLKQIARTRRSASVPVSPTEDKSPSLISSTMTPNASLQVNTSTTFLDMYKAEANSSPEFCSSPMDLNSTSSPSTPMYVFDNSPTIMDSSPLLNQDPFVSLPAHNLSSLTMDSSNLLSSDQIAAAMVNFAPSMSGLPNVSNDDFASMFNMNSGSDTASDVSEFMTFNEFSNDALCDNKDGFSSTGSMVNLDVSSWVGGDVAYC